MKSLNASYYFLFVLLITGGFASMAQNDYGQLILSFVSVSFGVLFAIQLGRLFAPGVRKDWWEIIEVGSIVIICAVLALRILYIHFRFVETVFALAGTGLISAYIRSVWSTSAVIGKRNRILAYQLMFFRASLLLYIFSMISVPFFPGLSEPAGMAAFGAIVVFAGMSITAKKAVLEGENFSGFGVLKLVGHRALVLIILFLVFTAYMGFTRIGLFPHMYSDQFPRAYFEMVREAEAGTPAMINGRLKYEVFKQNYDRLVSRHVSN